MRSSWTAHADQPPRTAAQHREMLAFISGHKPSFNWIPLSMRPSTATIFAPCFMGNSEDTRVSSALWKGNHHLPQSSSSALAASFVSQPFHSSLALPPSIFRLLELADLLLEAATLLLKGLLPTLDALTACSVLSHFPSAFSAQPQLGTIRHRVRQRNIHGGGRTTVVTRICQLLQSRGDRPAGPALKPEKPPSAESPRLPAGTTAVRPPLTT